MGEPPRLRELGCPDQLSGGGPSPSALSPGRPLGSPGSHHPATRLTRQPAYEAARLIPQQKGGHGWPVGVATAQGEMGSGQGEYWPV